MKADMPLRSNRSAGAWFFVGSGREKPMRREDLKPLKGLRDDDVNIMLSRLWELYYVEDDAPAWVGVLHLNQLGETEAQAEFDRRFDMYLTRTASIAALILSALALIL